MRDLKTQIVLALSAWVSQRPGLDYGNYGDPVAYRAEVRSIGKDLQHARAMINYVAWHDSITAEVILNEFRAGGRFTCTVDGDKVTLDYCVGQYWCTEYRPAVCRLLSSVIWYWMRENAPVDAGPTIAHSNLQDVGGYIRRQAARELGTSIARRWFA